MKGHRTNKPGSDAVLSHFVEVTSDQKSAVTLDLRNRAEVRVGVKASAVQS